MANKKNEITFETAPDKIKSFIKNTIKSYQTVGFKLHAAACMAFYHAAEHGDPVYLNQLYAGLRVNDQTALRVWSGKHATVDLNEDVESDANMYTWLGFKKDSGFFVKQGSENARKGRYSGEGLMALDSFLTKDVRDKDSLTLEALLGMIAQVEKRMAKKAETEGLDFPEATAKALHNLTLVAEADKLAAATAIVANDDTSSETMEKSPALNKG